MIALEKLLSIMALLRDPNGGCPWDLEQDFASIAPYTIEEAYEVADAIEQNDMEALKDELGDLLLQIVFHSQMAAERGLFTFADVADHVADKMVRRHPHVFGDAHAASANDVSAVWEAVKDQENKRRTASSVLDDVPNSLPAITKAQKLQKRAASIGFEWENAQGALEKLDEEIAELKAAVDKGDEENIADELGDVFFTLVNYGRMRGLDCEAVVRKSNVKFTNRFKYVETKVKQTSQATLADMEIFWQEAKQSQK